MSSIFLCNTCVIGIQFSNSHVISDATQSQSVGESHPGPAQALSAYKSCKRHAESDKREMAQSVPDPFPHEG